MRTLKNLSLTLIFITSFYSTSQAVIFNGENSVINSDKVKPVSAAKNKKHFVNAAINNGKLIPQVNLPEITIYAERNIKNRLPVAIRGNETIANVDLPEVVISAEKKTTGFKLRSEPGKNGIVYVADLPEVVINGAKVISDFTVLQLANDYKTPVVNLPEIVITAGFPESKIIAAVFYKGEFIPSIYLPVVEITAAKQEVFLSSNESSKNSNGTDFVSSGIVKAEAKMNKSLTHFILTLVKTCFWKYSLS